MTVNNVLNVIAEEPVRSNVILQAAKAVKKDGTAYFKIYERDGNGEGVRTPKGWQNNMKAQDYVPEVEQHFSDVSVRGDIIVAQGPKNTEGPALWNLGGETEIKFHKETDNEPTTVPYENEEEASIQHLLDRYVKQAPKAKQAEVRKEVEKEDKTYRTEFPGMEREALKHAVKEIKKERPPRKPPVTDETGWLVEPPNTGFLERLLASPEYYFEKVPAAWKTVQAAIKRGDDFTATFRRMVFEGNKDLLGVLRTFQKQNPGEYKKLGELLE